MSPRLPQVKPDDVIAALQRAGWEIARQRGSHATMVKAGMQVVLTVPRHRRDMPKGTLREIIRDSGLTVEEFVGLL